MTLEQLLGQAAPEVVRLFTDGGPLHDLVAKVRTERDAAFDGSVLYAFAMLRSEDLRFYEFLRDQLKAAGVPITALERLIEKGDSKTRNRRMF